MEKGLLNLLRLLVARWREVMQTIDEDCELTKCGQRQFSTSWDEGKRTAMTRTHNQNSRKKHSLHNGRHVTIYVEICARCYALTWFPSRHCASSSRGHYILQCLSRDHAFFTIILNVLNHHLISNTISAFQLELLIPFSFNFISPFSSKSNSTKFRHRAVVFLLRASIMCCKCEAHTLHLNGRCFIWRFEWVDPATTFTRSVELYSLRLCDQNNT